jgi:hypothetical protein
MRAVFVYRLPYRLPFHELFGSQYRIRLQLSQ